MGDQLIGQLIGVVGLRSLLLFTVRDLGTVRY